jgi:hypothetical protein
MTRTCRPASPILNPGHIADGEANMTTWKPYTTQEMEGLLEEEQADLSPEEQIKFDRTRVPIRKVRCLYGGKPLDDILFVVASDGEAAIVFESIHEEFAFCEAPALDDEVVRHWTCCGGLSHALWHLK